MPLADILREQISARTKRQPTIGAATQPPYFGSVDPVAEYGAVEESYNPLEDLAPVGGLRRLLGLGGAALGLGTVPAWKLTKNAPSWLQRAFKGGKREVPLQGTTPRRLPTESPGLVKNPVTYELPESNAGLKQLLEQEGGAYTGLGGEEGMTRLYRGEGSEPIFHPERAQSTAGKWFTTKKSKAEDFKRGSRGSRLKFVDVPQGELEQYNISKVFENAWAPDEYLIPREIQDKLWARFLKEQPERKLPPVSGVPAKKSKVLIPEVVSTPSEERPRDLLRKLKLPTRLEDATPGTPLHEALYWWRAMGGDE